MTMANLQRAEAANLQKRQVKAPEVYRRDRGLLHTLLGLSSEREMLSHPEAAAAWEGYVIEETIPIRTHVRRADR